jgi:UDP-glucose 4-epimerase
LNVLVTGGAGYVGSFAVQALQERGHDVVVYDDLRLGHRQATGAEIVEGNLLDGARLDELLQSRHFEAAMHFAAYSLVAHSMREPGRYFENNLSGAVSLFNALQRNGVQRVVFSSSAAVYGEAQYVPIDEDHPKAPSNPYGETKLMMEALLRWFAECHGLRSVSLRYFSAAGAALDGSRGEDHEPETHLLPVTIQTALGQRGPMQLYGLDWPTRDGSNLRDYVHVLDLAEAHILALGSMEQTAGARAYNLGSGDGFTNLEIVQAVERISGRKVPWEPGPRRPGDPASLTASSARAMTELDWKPRYSDLETVVRSAWAWHSSHPRGYGS